MNKQLQPFTATDMSQIPPEWVEFLLSQQGTAMIALYLHDVAKALMRFRDIDEDALVEYVAYAKGEENYIGNDAFDLAQKTYARSQPLIARDGTIHVDVLDAVRMLAHIYGGEVVILPPIIRLDRGKLAEKLHEVMQHQLH